MGTSDYSRKDLVEVWCNQKLSKGSDISFDTGKRCEERLYNLKMKIVGYEWIDFQQFFYKKEAEDYINYINSLKKEGVLKSVEVDWNGDQIRVTVNNEVK